MRYLLIVAHPDDEVLGAGGTIRKLISEGHDIAVATMCQEAEARQGISDSLSADQQEAFDILGIKKSYSAYFPNIKMNTVPHLELVQFIENCIIDFNAECIITHHPTDTNNDHAVTSYAVQAACRIAQRRDNLPKLRQMLYMEVLSSTEWSLDSSSRKFNPNYYVEIDETGIEKKLEALSRYKGVIRYYPHPRSVEAIKGLAMYRGAQAGLMLAEAFECVFMCR